MTSWNSRKQSQSNCIFFFSSFAYSWLNEIKANVRSLNSQCNSVSVLKLLRDGRDVPVVTVLVVAFVVISVHVFWQRVVNVGCVDSDVRRSRNFFISNPLFSSFSCALASFDLAHEHARKKLRLKLSLKYAYKIGLTAEFEYDNQHTNKNNVTVKRVPHVSLGVVINDTWATQYGSQQNM